jgi:hypothetical protein
MGYNTRYVLECDNGDLVEELRAACEDAKYALNSDGSTNEPCKWYEHEEHLREFSRRHPGLLLTLSGNGEENEDIWKKYFRDGLCQEERAQMVIGEFDPAKLK